MALVSTVNGQPIYSDKRMTGINNGRVTFADGSWCDVSTGQVHNNGAGYIRIGGSDPGKNVEKITVGPKYAYATALEIRGIKADVVVEMDAAAANRREAGIEYTIKGPAEQIKAIRASVQDASLVIESDGTDSSNDGITIVGNSGGGVVIGGNSFMSSVFRGNRSVVITGDGGGQNDVTVTVKVPRGTPVHSNGVLGNVRIGNIDGPLIANAATSGTVRAGQVTSAQLMASTSGSIHVERVNGPVVAQANTSGEVTVNGGVMPSLTATASTSGSIDVRGTAASAMLTASTSGSVYAERVQQRPSQNQSTSGRVRVGKVG